MKEYEQQLQQAGQAIEAMSAELESKQAEQEAAQAKVMIEQEKIAIDRYNAETKRMVDTYNAETNRMKAEAESATKDLTDSERVQFEADLKVRMDERNQDHQHELEMVRRHYAMQPKADENSVILMG